MDLTNERMEVGATLWDGDAACTRLMVGPVFVGEVCGETIQEAQALARQIANRWNAVPEALDHFKSHPAMTLEEAVTDIQKPGE